MSSWVTGYAVTQRKASLGALNRWLTTSHTCQQSLRWWYMRKRDLKCKHVWEDAAVWTSRFSDALWSSFLLFSHTNTETNRDRVYSTLPGFNRVPVCICEWSTRPTHFITEALTATLSEVTGLYRLSQNNHSELKSLTHGKDLIDGSRLPSLCLISKHKYKMTVINHNISGSVNFKSLL